MSKFEEYVIKMLLDKEFSRNKNFDEYKDPVVQRAARFVRVIEQMREDLTRLDDEVKVKVEELPHQRVCLDLIYEPEEYRHTIILTPPIFEAFRTTLEPPILEVLSLK